MDPLTPAQVRRHVALAMVACGIKNTDRLRRIVEPSPAVTEVEDYEQRCREAGVPRLRDCFDD